MIYTVLNTLTTDELVQMVLNDDIENTVALELVSRIRLLEAEIEDLKNDRDGRGPV